jgi:hypothetical protein
MKSFKKVLTNSSSKNAQISQLQQIQAQQSKGGSLDACLHKLPLFTLLKQMDQSNELQGKAPNDLTWENVGDILWQIIDRKTDAIYDHYSKVFAPRELWQGLCRISISNHMGLSTVSSTPDFYFHKRQNQSRQSIGDSTGFNYEALYLLLKEPQLFISGLDIANLPEGFYVGECKTSYEDEAYGVTFDNKNKIPKDELNAFKKILENLKKQRKEENDCPTDEFEASNPQNNQLLAVLKSRAQLTKGGKTLDVCQASEVDKAFEDLLDTVRKCTGNQDFEFPKVPQHSRLLTDIYNPLVVISYMKQLMLNPRLHPEDIETQANSLVDLSITAGADVMGCMWTMNPPTVFVPEQHYDIKCDKLLSRNDWLKPRFINFFEYESDSFTKEAKKHFSDDPSNISEEEKNKLLNAIFYRAISQHSKRLSIAKYREIIKKLSNFDTEKRWLWLRVLAECTTGENYTDGCDQDFDNLFEKYN